MREQPTERRQARAAARRARGRERDEQPFPAIVVPVPGGAPHGAVAQRADGIAVGIELPRRRRRRRRMQQVSILGREQEDQPIDEAQKLSKEIGQRQRAGPQPLAQRGVVGMREKAVAQAQQRRLDAVAQALARSDALPLPGLAPAFERAIDRRRAGACPKRLEWISSHSAAKSANASPSKMRRRSASMIGGTRQAGIVAHEAEQDAVACTGPRARLRSALSQSWTAEAAERRRPSLGR